VGGKPKSPGMMLRVGEKMKIMKKKLLLAGFFVVILSGVTFSMSSFTCFRYTTTCGAKTAVCGSSVGQLMDMVNIAEGNLCGEYLYEF
jgi:uncharacterized membrane protein AbrB (regulator of aidB expression)